MRISSPSSNLNQPTGSQPDSEPVFLAVGKIRKPHGLRGELAMEVHTDFPERLNPGEFFYIGSDHEKIKLTKKRWHGKLLLITLEGFNSPEDAAIFRNQYVYVPSADRPPLPKGDYYHHQLLGLTVITDLGENLGQIVEIIETGANDVFIVRSADRPELLVPYVKSWVIKVDLTLKELHTQIPDGLLPDSTEA